MTVLASLVRANDRVANGADATTPGYARVPVGFLVPLAPDGIPAAPIDLRQEQGLRRQVAAPLMAVPQPPRRTVQIEPCLMWDKTAYALGVTGKEDKRTATEHAAWRTLHLEALATETDPGLLALLRFVENWQPERFQALGWPSAMLDQNIVFALESDRLDNIRIHDRPAARALVTQRSADDGRPEAFCLVTGESGPIARLHPAIKGVWGAQSSGAALVSYNADASESYGHKQGDNAPISAAAATAYTGALNRMLERDSPNRIQIGDATVVFWAEASSAGAAEVAEETFGAFFSGLPVADDRVEAAKVRSVLEKIRSGRPVAEVDPRLVEGVRFYVLGLSPNNARLSIRHWIADDFGHVAANLARHAEAMRIDPPPPGEGPSIWRCLIETAVQNKIENIQPTLAGEWLRAILAGGAYPQSLLSEVLSRIRADRNVNAIRVAIVKAVLTTNGTKGVPVSLDPINTEPGYLLGRLFAVYESIQAAVPGTKVNATIRDKFYASASATPRAVFPSLDRQSTHHLGRLRKETRLAPLFQRRLGEIYALSSPDKLFPATLAPTQQALFSIGYYHQRYNRTNNTVKPVPETEESN
jgi:CRISPR-associated protein Csd1